MKIDNQLLDQMNLLYENKVDPLTFKFDQLSGPTVYQMIPPQVIMHMYQYAVDPKYSKSLREKISHYDEVLAPYGFRRFAAGTNRAVYRFYEETSICLKVALDKVGVEANILEFKNQNFLKPFVAKCLSIDSTGVAAIYERVLPIRSRQEFIEIASDVFDVITNRFIGKYVLEDIGTNYFKNWGIREGFGPVLLDYPYAFEIDINGLFCNNMVNGLPIPCGGEIDYDVGYNYLYCLRCGRRHRARDIGKAIDSKLLKYNANGGQFKMEVEYFLDGKYIGSRNIADAEISTAEAKRAKAKADREKKNAAIRAKYGYCEDDFDVIYFINGIKYGKDKNGNLINLGRTGVKGEKLKDDNPFTKYVDNGKRPAPKPPKKPIFLGQEASSWATGNPNDTLDLSAQINANAKKDIVIDMTGSLPSRVGSIKPPKAPEVLSTAEQQPVGTIENMSEEVKTEIATNVMNILNQIHAEENDRVSIHQIPEAEISESDETEEEVINEPAEELESEEESTEEVNTQTEEEAEDAAEAEEETSDEESHPVNLGNCNEYVEENPEYMEEILKDISATNPTIIGTALSESELFELAKNSKIGDIITFCYNGGFATFIMTDHGMFMSGLVLPDGTTPDDSQQEPKPLSIETFKKMCDMFSDNKTDESETVEAEADESEDEETETDETSDESEDEETEADETSDDEDEEYKSLSETMLKDYDDNDDNVYQMTPEEIDKEREEREQAKAAYFGITDADYVRSKDICETTNTNPEDFEAVPPELTEAINNSANNDESKEEGSKPDISSF